MESFKLKNWLFVIYILYILGLLCLWEWKKDKRTQVEPTKSIAPRLAKKSQHKTMWASDWAGGSHPLQTRSSCSSDFRHLCIFSPYLASFPLPPMCPYSTVAMQSKYHIIYSMSSILYNNNSRLDFFLK